MTTIEFSAAENAKKMRLGVRNAIAQAKLTAAAKGHQNNGKVCAPAQLAAKTSSDKLTSQELHLAPRKS